MGYFSNGTEGMDYQERYCMKCVHGQDEEFGPAKCPIMTLHWLYNSESCTNDIIRLILDTLIPQCSDGPWNDECAMFFEPPGGTNEHE